MTRAWILALLVATAARADVKDLTKSDNWPCDTCHPAGAEDTGGEPAHDVTLKGHDRLGKGKQACLQCHSSDAKPELLLALDGKTTPIEKEVAPTCERCHFDVAKRWRAGAHGSGAKCNDTRCHDVHAPSRHTETVNRWKKAAGLPPAQPARTYMLFQPVALGFAALAAIILILYLLRRPPLQGSTKLWLLLGIGIFPIGAALTGNVVGFERSKEREFCGSCHTMERHVRDAADPASLTLAARHSRNPLFGSESCFTCHKDYVIFGDVLTKLRGMVHLWAYYTKYGPLASSPPSEIHLYKPYPDWNCMQCHAPTRPKWRAGHAGLLDSLVKGTQRCSDAKCHGPIHPREAKVVSR